MFCVAVVSLQLFCVRVDDTLNFLREQAMFNVFILVFMLKVQSRVK